MTTQSSTLSLKIETYVKKRLKIFVKSFANIVK